MGLQPSTYSVANLRLALDRVIRGSNRDYKQYFRHLYPSYALADSTLLPALSGALRSGTYQPGKPVFVYQPKKSGVLRPLTLLTLEDQIVYQALVNRVANRLQKQQDRHALTRSFGALYAGTTSQFFFRSWKVAYGKYNKAIADAFNGGKKWVAEFDLVSCYELIDHNLLRACIGKHVKDLDLVDLLCTCLGAWTTNSSGSHVRHGLPQGPEASAFLAECVLFRFDEAPLKNVTYLRYVDDIRMLGRDEMPLRKAMIRLDLLSKDLGLVPQAQKMGVRVYGSLNEILKSVPSSLVAVRPPGAPVKQKELLRMWRKSIVRRQGRWEVDDTTRFRFAVYRLAPRRPVLRRLATLLVHRPDLATTLSNYFRRFPQDREAADLLLDALKQDPAYDAAAAAYVAALDACEPPAGAAVYRRAVRTALRRSVEGSTLLRTAVLRFQGKRLGPSDLMHLLSREKEPSVVGQVLASVCDGAGGEPFTTKALAPLLAKLTIGSDGDLARFAASLLVVDSAVTGSTWRAPRGVHPAVKDLLVALGLRTRGAKRPTAIELYFDRMGVKTPLPWRRALGGGLRDVERRSVRLQHLKVTDPSAFVLMLDTFNESLLQAFSRRHPKLASPFSAAAGTNAHPDLGNWLDNPALGTVIPNARQWFKDIHRLRLDSDLAHAKHKKGPQKGKPTNEITHPRVNAALKGARQAWTELIHAWQPLL